MPRLTDQDPISNPCRGRWPGILMQLGLLDHKALAGRHVPCPMCGGRDRFHFSDRDIGRWHCRGCGEGGDGLRLIERIKGVGFAEAAELVEGVIGGSRRPQDRRSTPRRPQHLRPAPRPPAAVPEARNGVSTTAQALALWSEARDPRRTRAELYLRHWRKLDLPEDLAGEVLRWHPGVGAMLALFRNIMTGEPQAVSRTFLDSHARKIERKFLGPVGGAAMMLDPFDEVTHGLFICEGLETGMAARRYQLRPIWALGSAGEIERLPVLGGVECLTILGENDCAANARAIEACGARWHAAGREVQIVNPTFGKDLNDTIMSKEKAAHPARKAALSEE
jgi:hypothetical protein